MKFTSKIFLLSHKTIMSISDLVQFERFLTTKLREFSYFRDLVDDLYL